VAREAEAMASARLSGWFLPVSFALLICGLWIAVDSDDEAYMPVLATAVALVAGVALSRGWQRRWVADARQARRPDARAHRPFPFRRLVQRAQVREGLDDVLDRLRFRIDVFPNGLYQPVRSLPRSAASRSSGSESRWDAIAPIIRSEAVKSAVDIGACEGYFAIELAEAGVHTIAIESAPGNYRTMLFAVKRSGTPNVGVLAMEVAPENVDTLPVSDCVLCLSIWHHFVRSHGLEQATAMLEAIWQRSRKVMFFDTGETEMTPDYGLPPMLPDPRSWLADYLGRTCTGSRVEHLGLHAAFDPAGNPCRRNLFAVIRTDGGGGTAPR
jgi:hypothetical protein